MAATDPVVQSNGHDPDPRPIVRVLHAIPDEGFTQTEALVNIRLLSFHHGVLQERSVLDRTLPRYEFYIHHLGRLLTAINREYAAKFALELKADWLLFTDSDGTFPVDLFERLSAHQVDIVGPLAFTRNEPHLPVIYEIEQGFDAAIQKPYFLSRFVTKYPRNSLVECDALGFHAVLIKVDVLRRMTPPYFFSMSGTGEDIFFCIKAKREANAHIFCDTSIKTGHLTNPRIVDEDYALKNWKDHGIDVDNGMGSISRYVPVPQVPRDEADARVTWGV